MTQICDLVGSWTLLSASTTDDRGQRDKAPFGEGAVGRLVYTDDGRVFAIICHGDRDTFVSDDLSVAPPSALAAAFRTVNAYAGRYTLSGDQVTHHIEAASFPNWMGIDLVRTARCSGDQLTLQTSPHLVDGSPRAFAIVWQRCI